MKVVTAILIVVLLLGVAEASVVRAHWRLWYLRLLCVVVALVMGRLHHLSVRVEVISVLHLLLHRHPLTCLVVVSVVLRDVDRVRATLVIVCVHGAVVAARLVHSTELELRLLAIAAIIVAWVLHHIAELLMRHLL